LILRKLFPHLGLILTDADPMPLFGLKLLSVIVERNSAFIVILSKLNLIEIIFSYFEINHPKFNAFTIKIVRAIIASREMELGELMKLKVVDKMNGIFKNVMSNNPEWCTDHLLEIINEVLHIASEMKKKKDKQFEATFEGSNELRKIDINTEKQEDGNLAQTIYDKFLTNYAHFFTLLSASDIAIVEKAA
jgi:hypothetical protein